jgi:hypothetical protein
MVIICSSLGVLMRRWAGRAPPAVVAAGHAADDGALLPLPVKRLPLAWIRYRADRLTVPYLRGPG